MGSSGTKPLMFYSVADRLGDAMRISDKVLKCAVFLGVLENDAFRPLGTGFLVVVPEGGLAFQYVITCQHNIIQAGARPLHIRVNCISGGARVTEEIPPEEWSYHPDSSRRFIDVAVMPIRLPPDIFDIVCVKFGDLWPREKVEERNIGVGEDLFYPGLFVHHSGQKSNLPIMRSGILSAMPVEPVGTPRGPIEAYLMESRSIGGHSGSPVFANLFDRRNFYTDRPAPLPHPKEETRYPVLGLLRSYFKATDESISTEMPGDDLSLNSGISTIIPSWEIIETLMREELILEREKAVDTQRKLSAEVEASTAPARDNPSHKEDFTRLLDAAVRSNKPVSET